MKKIVTGDYRLVKKLNSSTVLNLIRTRAPISGADLAKITHMRPSTVMKILRSLERKGLIVKIGQGNSTRLGGRRPILWEVCASYGYVIGIQLELNEIRGLLVNLNSQIISEKQIKIRKWNSLTEIEGKVVEVVDDLQYANKISRRHILGLGIGVSGLVDIENGAIIKSSLLPLSNLPIQLGDSLKKRFDFPIYVENDANAAVLAEKWFGQARGIDHVIFTLVVVELNVFGIGYGLVLDNHIYRGAHMFAGETNPAMTNVKQFFMDILDPDQDGQVILNGQNYGIEEIEITQLLWALKSNDRLAIEFFEKVGALIGQKLIPLINLLDPALIIIGGEIAQAGSHLLDPIIARIRQAINSVYRRNLQMVESALANHAVPLGAASLVLEKIFELPLTENDTL